jgi:hypothetical protein
MLAALKYWFTELFLCKAMHGRRLIAGWLVNVVVAALPFRRQQILLQQRVLYRRLLDHGAERALLV